MFDFPPLDKDEFEALLKQPEPDQEVYDILFADFPLPSEEGKLADVEQPVRVFHEKPSSTKSALKTGKWSKEEDEILTAEVNAYISKNQSIDFAQIIKKLPNRSIKQAKERWMNCLKPNIKKGAWSDAEMTQLLDEMIANKQNWTTIQKQIPNRSMHCIKSKGRKILGEVMSKRLQKLTKKKVKKWTQGEESQAVELHLGIMTQRFPHLLRKGVTEAEVDEFLLTKEFEEMLESICIALGTGKPTAQIDRKLIELCSCPFCLLRRQRLSNGRNFKDNWTILKARRLKISLKSTMTKETKPTVSKIVPELTDKDLLELKLEENVENLTEDLALDFLFGQPATNEPPEEAEMLSLDTEDLLITPPEAQFHRKRSNDSLCSSDEFSSAPVRSLRKIDYEDQEMLRSLLFTAVEEDREDDEAEKVLTMVRNYERHKSANDSSGIAKRLIEVMTHVYGKEGFNKFANTMKDNNFTWFDPSICKVLDQLKPHSSDPRFTKRFLCPEPHEAPFDPFLPIGTFVINFITKIVQDADSNALAIARGDTRNKHSWKFVPGRAEAVLRLYYIMPSLQRTGKAISHIRWYRCDGTMGVFLCYYEVISFSPFTVKARFQDVSHKMREVLELPDFY